MKGLRGKDIQFEITSFSVKLEGEDIFLARIFHAETGEISWIELDYQENLNPIEQTNSTQKNIYHFTIKSVLLALPTILCFFNGYLAAEIHYDVEDHFNFIC